MGIIILIIAFVIEIGFAAYCFATRSRQPQVRSKIWLGAFAVFILCILAAVIQWSFRWRLIGGMLLIWAVMGAWRLLRQPAEPKPFSAVRTVFNTIGILLLLLLAMTPVLIFPQFTLPAPTGQYTVATASFTYTDENRVETFTNTGEPRKVNVKFWFPQDAAGTYPLVVFSHGTGGIKSSNTSTFMELASNGYVVGSIDHPYHSLFTIGADGKFVRIDGAYWQEYMSVVSHTVDAATRYQLTQKWLALRAADMNFVIDTILAQVKDGNAAAVYRLIDPTKIGVMGHSLGGGESGQVARIRSDISAVINLDGDLHGEYVDFVDGNEVLNEQPFPAPLLNIYADDMQRALATIPNAADVVASEHARATAPHGYDVYLPGTNHFSVTDLPLASPFMVSLMTSVVPGAAGGGADPYATIAKMNGIILHFFNMYLKGEGAFTGE
jgi:dienelactone hydrolase